MWQSQAVGLVLALGIWVRFRLLVRVLVRLLG